MADEIFTDVPSEGASLDIEKAFQRLETKGDKTSSESQTENKNTDKPSQKGVNTSAQNIPFHKHPRWQATQKELKELRETVLKFQQGQQTQSEPPAWWKTQYGDTAESRKRYQNVLQKDGELDWLKAQIKEDLQRERQADEATQQAGEEYVNTSLQEMAEEGLKFEKNKLLKFMVDYQNEFGGGALLDSEGNYDFRKSLTLMNRMKPYNATPNIQKQVASMGGRGKAGTSQTPGVPVLSRNALRRGNWRDAETGQFTRK
jgi:FtsZ-interacting cell division protein ZipA